MISVELQNETDFKGWRRYARGLALNDVPASNVVWSIGGAQAELLGDSFDPEPSTSQRPFSVPKEFIELAEVAILHRNTERFALLYRLLLRLRTEHALLDNAIDADVAELRGMAKAVRRDEHKMHAFVRFREVAMDQGPHFVAWFEPAHHIVEFAAPFFVERFADMSWSILTPDRCAHWDKKALSFTAGVSKLDAPSEDRLEDVWRSYYASIFNPARLKVKAMQGHMPKKYWRNLPEASLIKPLIGAAERATSAMIDAVPLEPARQQRREMTMSRSSHDSLSAVRSEAEHCRDCPLWENATQVVFGEGPQDASVMLVGEQPGDKEDLAGKPFVGPAGQVLDRALREAGVDREKTYFTNAVKHFKFVLRGKVRLHQKPGTTEIRACRQWYQRELAAVRPQLVVALGATAAQAVFGKATPVNKNRGRVIELADGTHVLVTVHPSYLLRLPDEHAQREEYGRFVEDLKIAERYLKEHARAA